MPFSVRFLYGYSVDIVVCAERYDFFVWRNVVNYAASNPVNVEVVGIHERHTAEEENASPDFSKRLI